MSHEVNQKNQPKEPFRLHYRDYKSLERIIESYNMKEGTEDVVDFNRMASDEKSILWKIKTIIRNMESIRLRINQDNQNQGE